MRIQTCFGFWGWACCWVSCSGLFSAEAVFDRDLNANDLERVACAAELFKVPAELQTVRFRSVACGESNGVQHFVRPVQIPCGLVAFGVIIPDTEVSCCRVLHNVKLPREWLVSFHFASPL